MLKRLTFIFLLLLCTLSSKTWGQANYFFKQISLEEGLTQATVRCILYDSKGFLWIGTRSGLNRYDTYELKTYQNSTTDSTSLPSNHILFLAEDKQGSVWIGTDNGVMVYTHETDSFTPFLYNEKPYRGKSINMVDDGILFGSSGKLYKYSYESESLKPIQFSNNSKITDNITHIEKWKDSLFIIGTRWDGVWIYNDKDKSIRPTPFCTSKQIMSLYIDKYKNVWISPYGKGASCYSPTGKLIRELNTSNKGVNNDVVLDIIEKDDEIWLATDGGGISILNTLTNEISVLEYLSGDRYSFPGNSVYCLYVDRENNMWAGTIRAGLVGIKKVHMRTYKDAPPESHFGLSEKTVLNIIEAHNGIIWIGTDGGGLNSFNPKKNTFKHFMTTDKMKVVALAEYDNEHILISNFSKGLSLFNKKTERITPFTLVDKATNERNCRSGSSVNLLSYNQDSIYIFTDNIYIYNKKTKSFSTVRSQDPAMGASFMQLMSKNKQFTYLFFYHEIVRLNNKTQQLDVILKTDANTTINTATEGKNGELWIGTDRGLQHLKAGETNAVNIKTALIHDISSLVYDNKDRLWIGVRGMLYSYFPHQNRFIVFGESDGAPSNEYLTKPTLVSSDSSIYMGGVMGLLHIANSVPLEEKDSPQLALSSFSIDGIPVLNMGEQKRISVPWSHSLLSVRSMTKDKDIFRERIYRYSITGKETHVIETYEKEIALHSLPIGKYKIQVSCSTRDGNWSESSETTSFEVLPPWWQTWWFILLISLFVLVTIYGLIRYTLQRKESKLELDKKEHERHIYEDKVRFLINISHELRTPLTLIYAPLKRLTANIDKDNQLFTPLNQILKQASQMRNIINMVLDIRRMEVKDDILKIEQIDLNTWLEELADNFQPEIAAKNIQINLSLDTGITSLSLDRNKCEIIFSNLLMNALKFSPNDSLITVSSTLLPDSVKIAISDQGIGLKDIDADKLFSRFYQGNHSVSGSGIGLSYSKQLVKLQNGQIGAHSNDANGATFWFSLPLALASNEVQKGKRPSLNEVLSSDDDYSIVVEDTKFDLSTYSIVVVEDSIDLQTFLKDTLKEYFKYVYVSSNGIEALETIKHKQPDIIISDVMMPRMNGFELCKAVKGDLEVSHIPVILLTARVDKDSAGLGYKLGADAYLPKPFDITVLMAILKNQLQTRENTKQRYLKNQLIIDPKQNTFSNSDEVFMIKLNEIIAKNIDNTQLDVSLITDKMGMSRASLYNKFKAIAGIGINDYIVNYRIDQADSLLVNTNHSIGEVSDMTGFSNQRYFSTVFKQAKGMSPSEYRKVNQINE